MRDAPRLLVPHPLHEGAAIPLAASQAHYLLSVLRLPPGAPLRLFNGRDGEWSARLAIPDRAPDRAADRARGRVPDGAPARAPTRAEAAPQGRDQGRHQARPQGRDQARPQGREQGREQAWAELQARLRPQAPEPDLWLLFAPLKRDATDLVVQKATELGASALLPVLTERTNTPRLNQARLEAIAAEAAEQCERLTLPVLHPLRRLADVLADWPPGRPLTCALERIDAPPILPRPRRPQPVTPPAARLIDPGSGAPPPLASISPEPRAPSPAPPASPESDAPPPAPPASPESDAPPPAPPASPEFDAQPAALLVGPEGGFTPRELDALRRHPFVLPVTLGPRILRAETAAIVGLALLQASLAPAPGRAADGPDPTC